MTLLRVRHLVLAVALLAGRAAAADPPLPLRYDLVLDLSITGAALASAAVLGILKPELAPLQCRFCAPNALDDSIQRGVVWRDPQAADTWSSVVANVFLPVALLGYGLGSAWAAGDLGAGAVDVLLIVEAVSLATVLEEITKYATGRLRPYAWYGHEPARAGAYDQNLSFYSGHTSFAFTSAASAGTIFLMRGYPGAPVVLGVGLAAAAAVGYFRMAADMHYFTDVLAGAAVGGFVGFAVPWFFHRPRGAAPQAGDLLPDPGGLAIAW